MTYTPTVTVSYGGPYSNEVELIAGTLKINPSFSNWDALFPNPTGISAGAVRWINANENPATVADTAVDDAPGPVTSGDPQTTVDPVQVMATENPLPYPKSFADGSA